MKKTQIKTYPNGLRIAVTKLPVRSVTCGIMVNAASYNEDDANNGISHFIEHMTFKGTNTRTAAQIAEQFDSLGAVNNAFTAKENTCYYYKSIDENNEKCFELLCDIVLHSTYNSDELDRERKVICEEINMSEDDPDGLCYDALCKAVYGHEGYGRTILGPSENVLRFNKNDVLNYKNAHYFPANTVIGFAGNIDMDAAEKLVDKYMGEWTHLEAKPTLTKTPVTYNKPCSEFVKKPFEQAVIGFAYPTIDFSNDKIAAQSVADGILGGGMSSRLFQRLREQLGLVYSIYSSTSTASNAGAFTVYFNVNPKNAAHSVEVVNDEVKKFAASGITADELNKSKTLAKVAALFSLENPRSVLFSSLRYLTMGNKVYDVDEITERIENVTLEDVNSFVSDYLSVTPHCAYVGINCDKELFKGI